MNMDLNTGARFLAWTLLSTIVALTYVPPAWRVVTGASHGAEHFMIFLLAGGFFALGYRRNPAALGILAIALSGLLELLQLIVPGRHARPSDFAINAFAACLGIAAVWLSGRIRRYG
mgnify:CR=1 FL=1